MFTQLLRIVFKHAGHLALVDATAKALASFKLIVAFIVHCHLSDVALHDVGSSAESSRRVGHCEACGNITQHHTCISQNGFLQTFKG